MFVINFCKMSNKEKHPSHLLTKSHICHSPLTPFFTIHLSLQLLVCFSATVSSLPPQVFTCPVLSGVSRYPNTSLHVSKDALAVLPHNNHVLIILTSLSKSCKYILQTILSSKSFISISKLCF